MTDKQARGKLPLYTTPKGRLLFPKLIVPDTKFDKDGRLGTGLLLDSTNAEKLIEVLAPGHKQAVEDAEIARNDKLASLRPHEQKKVKPIEVNPFFQEDLDKETGEPTGDTLFRFSVKAKGVARKQGKEEVFQRRIVLFDAKGKPIKGGLEIWSGTVGRVTFVAVPYYVPATGACGLSMRPVAVQVIDLVAKGAGKSASHYGFEAEEGGFEHTDPSDEPSEGTGDAEKADGPQDEADDELLGL